MKKYPNVFKQVIRRPSRVYEIHWEHLPSEILTPLDEIKPLWDPRKDLAEEEKELSKIIK
jgi:hypothetical protein